MNRDQLIALVTVTVAGVWAIVAMVDLLLEDYTALSIATPVMLLVVGAILGLTKRNGGSR